MVESCFHGMSPEEQDRANLIIGTVSEILGNPKGNPLEDPVVACDYPGPYRYVEVLGMAGHGVIVEEEALAVPVQEVREFIIKHGGELQNHQHDAKV